MLKGQILCTPKELDLGITLNGGQSFRWLPTDDRKQYRGVFKEYVWTLSQDEAYLHYAVHNPSNKGTNYVSILSNYFRLDTSLEKNLKKWRSSDSNFQKLCENIAGVRILDQDVVENLFSFICSSNNNINRISGMIEKLCRFFGEKLCDIDGIEYFNFPSIKALMEPEVEGTLRKQGFGYRAAYVANTAKHLDKLGGRSWLLELHKDNNATYQEARAKLMTLPGVGPKVADCICLMSLGHLEAIPVDTHIFQIAQKYYMPQLVKQKTVTPKIHGEVSEHLRELWGPLAGWAQAVVFCAKINNSDITLKNRKRPKPDNSKTQSNSKKKQ
ncbi:N-glycosylase/DNA lyase [Orussus abietinus]|uniref:N-glycosylase/DNA lyase n=1 Tax=Orussus abietinus TaxID=222816 RepID=UPI00062620BF|nr:N-glycosylase/DNA lyase [Orussus abietinus]